MDLERKGSMRIFMHGHHIRRDRYGNIMDGYGDSENIPHVHVVDENGRSNSFDLDYGECLQSDIVINRRACQWFYEELSCNSYSWKRQWDSMGTDYCDDLLLDIDCNQRKVKSLMPKKRK